MNYDSYDGTTGALIGLVITLAVFAFYFLIIAALYVLMALALSSFFRKVGVEPWIGWIPIYGYWKWLEVGGQPGWLSVLAIVPYAGIVTSVFLAIGMYRTGIAFRKDGSWVVLGIFLPFVWLFLLARDIEHYEPSLITAAGFSPPLAGYGSFSAATAAP
ncbi:MAG: DUF5684 domain-containing protein [Pseudolysinimonas sp.]